MLVLAGAGSGKTRVLTYRIAWLASEKGVAPRRILALTFTNKAAGEMKARVERLLGGQTGLWIGTFHSLFARVLREDAEVLGYNRNFSIYDTDDSQRLIKNILKDLPGTSALNPTTVPSRDQPRQERAAHARGAAPGAPPFRRGELGEVYALYCRRLKENNAMDFDDLILKPMELFHAAPSVLERYRRQFQHVLIDEFQDTNRTQYNLVRMLAGEARNICVVGDDDQSIYGWRGADMRNILDFEHDFPGVVTVRLEQNYRSCANILEVANAVVSRNIGRKPKRLWTEAPAGAKAVILEAQNEMDEAEQIASCAARVRSELELQWRDFAVLYRTNAQSRALEDAMRRGQVPYRIIGGQRFYERKEIKDLLAYLKVIANPRDSASLYRVINVPSRGIGPITLTRLTELALARGESLFHVLADADRAEGIGPAVARKVMELHTNLEELRQRSRTESAATILRELIRVSEYENELMDLETIEAQSRMDNIAELVSAAEEFSERFSGEGEQSCLEAWLAETSLVSEIDFMNPGEDYLTLMTLHNAKGLEFPVVFIGGVEENLLPISRAQEDETGSAIEEERRLFYVGITRARQRLFLSWAAYRRRYADLLEAGPSNFLADIPGELIDRHASVRRRGEGVQQSWKGASSFERYARGPLGGMPPLSGSRHHPPEPKRPAAAASSGPVLEREPGVDEPAYQQGERVVHHQFGSGTIIEVASYLDELRVSVRFDSGFTKKLVARFAKLRRE